MRKLYKSSGKLHYSQSGISRMIQDLEKEWKVSLLERDRNGVSLTSDGQVLLPFARDVVTGYRRLQTKIDELNGLKYGMIRIGTFSSVATHWLPNIIKRFQKDYPNVEYEFLTGDYEEIEEWVKTGRVDCGFVRLPVSSEFETIFLEQDTYMAVLSKNHELVDRKEFPISYFEKEPFLLLEHGKRTEVSEYLRKYNITPKIQFTTWDDYSIMSMVESGLGISILPKLILRRIPYRIKALPLSEPLHRDIGLILNSNKTASVATKTFIQYLKYR